MYAGIFFRRPSSGRANFPEGLTATALALLPLPSLPQCACFLAVASTAAAADNNNNNMPRVGLWPLVHTTKPHPNQKPYLTPRLRDVCGRYL
jgi:hypothetical protein